MADIDVAKPFKLTHDDGSVTHFVKGEQSVPDDVAVHWYVKAHLVGAEPHQHAQGSPNALIAAGRAAQKDAEEKALAEAEAEKKAREALQTKNAAELAERTKAAISKQAEAAERAAATPQRAAGKGGR